MLNKQQKIQMIEKSLNECRERHDMAGVRYYNIMLNELRAS
jgi:hypothetical protein